MERSRGTRLLSSQGNLVEEGLGSSGSSLVDYVTGVWHGAEVPTRDKDAACGCPE